MLAKTRYCSWLDGLHLLEWPSMKRLLGRKYRRVTLVFTFCVSVIVGVGLAHAGHLIDFTWCALVGAVAIFSARRRNAWVVLWIVLFGLSLGWWRGSVYMTKLADYQNLFGQKITFSAIANEDAAYGKHSQLTFIANHITLENGKRLAGKISLSGFGVSAIYKGDEVVARGKMFPTLGSSQAKVSYASLEVVAHRASLVDNIRRHFAAGMQSALPEPVASFGLGLLIGQRSTLPDDIKNDLLAVGLTHIIAVSGYNLTIMLKAAEGTLARRSKRQSTLLALALVGVFMLFTGSSASIVRAAIVSLLSIAAAYYGRKFKSVVLIALAAAITAFANPFYVWSDAGWYLSFLAFYGVLVLAPLIASRWPAKFKNSLILMVALESLCAEIMVLPFVLHTFGQVSFISLLANVMVVALVPLAMLLSLVAGLTGMLLPAVAGWLAWPAKLLLTYMLDIAHILSQIPRVFVQNLSLPITSLAFLYAALGAITLVMWSKNKRRNAIITDEADRTV